MGLATAGLLAVSVGLVVVPTAAYAATIGTLTVNPSSGTDNTPLSVTTSGGCNGNGTNYQVRILGSGFAPENAEGTGGTSVTNNISQPSGNGPITAPLNDTLAAFAAQQSPPANLNGDYVLKLICRSRLASDNLADFRVTIRFSASGSSKNFVVVPNATSTTVTASPQSPQTAGTSVTFTATITPPNAAGTVQFRNGTSNLGTPQTVSDGTATLVTSALPVGDNQISAVFTPTNANTFATSTSPTITYTVTARPATATTTTITSVTPASPRTQGTTVTFTVTVSPSDAAGSVQLRSNGTAVGTPVTVTNGSASINTDALPIGDNQQITAVFTPTDAAAFGSSTSPPVSYTVTAVPSTTTTLAVSPAAEQVVGQPVTLTATITPSGAVGTVQFRNGTTNLGGAAPVSSGTASITTSDLPAGANSLTATFIPTDATAFQTSTSGATSYRVFIPTATTLTAAPGSTSVESTEVTLTAGVDAVAAGTIEFFDDAASLGSVAVAADEDAELLVDDLPVGSRSLTARFTPTDAVRFEGSTSPDVTYTVTAAPAGGGGALATTTTLAVSPASPQPRDTAVTLTATVAPSARGSVQFFDSATSLGNAPIEGGEASVVTRTLAAGSHSLRAVFTPANANAYAGSTSPTVAYTITAPARTTTTLSISPASPQVRGTALTLTAFVTPPTAAGTVQFLDGPTVIGTAPVSNGRATLSVASPTVGTRSFTARFVPANSTDFVPSTSPTVSFTTTAPAVVPPASVTGVACQIVITPKGRKTAVPKGCVPMAPNLTPCTYFLNSTTGRKSSMPKGCLPQPKTSTFCSVVIDRNGRKGVLPRPCVPVVSFLPDVAAPTGRPQAL